MEITTSMTDDKPQGEKKLLKLKTGPRAKIWHMIIAGIIVLFYLVWLGDRTFGPPAPYESDKTRANEALTAKVSPQAGPDGDLSKVKPVDREAFLAMLRGAPVSPKSVLVNFWKDNHQSPETKWHNFLKHFQGWFP